MKNNISIDNIIPFTQKEAFLFGGFPKTRDFKADLEIKKNLELVKKIKAERKLKEYYVKKLEKNYNR
jgi:hypothetical protein